MNYLISKITKLHKFKNARLRKKTVIVQAQLKKNVSSTSQFQNIKRWGRMGWDGRIRVRVIPALGIGCGEEAGVQRWDYG